MKKTNITRYVSRNIWSSTRLWNKFKTNFLCFVKPRSVAGCLWVKDSYRSLGGIKSELPGGSDSRPFWCSAALPSIPKVLLPSPSCGVWQIFTEHLIVWDELASDHEVAKKARSQYEMYFWFGWSTYEGQPSPNKRMTYVWYCVLPASRVIEWCRMWKPESTVRTMFATIPLEAPTVWTMFATEGCLFLAPTIQLRRAVQLTSRQTSAFHSDGVHLF